jgi:hypothetical protein
MSSFCSFTVIIGEAVDLFFHQLPKKEANYGGFNLQAPLSYFY